MRVTVDFLGDMAEYSFSDPVRESPKGSGESTAGELVEAILQKLTEWPCSCVSLDHSSVVDICI